MKVALVQTKKTTRFKTQHKRLRNTLKSWRLSRVLDHPKEETVMLIAYLKKGKTFVLKSSRFNVRNQGKEKKLIRLNRGIARYFQTKLQVKTVSAVIGVDDLEDKMDQLRLVSADFGSCTQQLPIELPTLRNKSLSTRFVFSNWYHQLALKVQKLTFNVRSKNYSLPDSIKKMSQLKVLTIKSFSDYPSKLHNLSFIGCLPNLREIRFEHVSVSSLEPVFALKNLTHLSFVMCEIGNALMSHTTHSPHTLPNLTTLEIDMCYDLKELPSWLCDLFHLQKLSITNCQELDVLPKRLGGLSNLEDLNLHCCTKLQELPESIGNLNKLRSTDISDCLSISALPEEFGELCGLRVFKMNGCGGLQELPMSTTELLKLEEVICDEETSYLWMDFESDLPNLKINVVEDDRLESFMKIVQ